MSYMVSARVPGDLYSEGIRKLKKMNAGVTDLVRAAFEYVVEHGEMPATGKPALKPGKRTLSGKKLKEFENLFESGDIDIVVPDDFDYKEILSGGLKDDYEALS